MAIATKPLGSSKQNCR